MVWNVLFLCLKKKNLYLKGITALKQKDKIPVMDS